MSCPSFFGSLNKTVYDQKIIGDDEMVSLGQVAAAKSFKPGASMDGFDTEAGGIKFTVYSNQNGEIRNIFLSLPNE